MALTSTLQPVTPPAESAPLTHVPDALMSLIVMSVLAAQTGKKGIAKLKRKLFWQSLKLKAANLFKKLPPAISNQSLLIIIVVILALILLLTVSWQTALVLLLAGILFALIFKW